MDAADVILLPLIHVYIRSRDGKITESAFLGRGFWVNRASAQGFVFSRSVVVLSSFFWLINVVDIKEGCD